MLRECQRASIEDVNRRICVSRHWAEVLERDHGVDAEVIPNGVDAARFAGCRLGRAEAGARMGWGARPAILAIGGIEPRKGSRTLLEAFARARAALGPGALLAIAGGETLFDYADYRAAWEGDAARLGLRVHRGPAPAAGADVAVLGPVADAEMPTLYRAADAFAFPSEREGFGLVVLEAQAAGLPVVASDLPVLREFLSPGEDCLMVPAGDAAALAEALVAATAARPGAGAARSPPAGRRPAASPGRPPRRRTRRSTGRCVSLRDEHEYAVWTAEWKGGLAADVSGRGHAIRTDEPEEFGGQDTGPMPTELVAAALASCFCVAIVWAARKRRIELGDLEVQVQPHRQVGEPRHGSYDLWVHSSTPPAEHRPRGRAGQALLLGHEHARPSAGDPLPPGRSHRVASRFPPRMGEA